MKKFILFTLCLLGTIQMLQATKLVEVKVVDKDHIMLYFQDGEVTFIDDGLGSSAYTNHAGGASENQLVKFGTALATANVATITNWTIKSTDDANFGTAGKNPTNVYRKSKISGMSEEGWNSTTNDFNYDYAFEHTVYLKLPFSMVQGKSYTIQINANINSDVTTKTFTYDIYTSKSDAVKVNIVGYSTAPTIKAADVYMWMGDGGARNYSTFVGNDVFIYNVNTGASQKVGTLALWQAAAAEYTDNHKMIQSNVWKADFTGFNTPGTYRIAVTGIGCSDDFVIAADAYLNPFKVNTQGFFYMRIGENANGTNPVPRRPLWIPKSSPTDCEVIITTMHPYHPEWSTFCSGDKWDCKNGTDGTGEWALYATTRKNPNAFGGHSDALDWDRHLGHVPILYDMLLPYFLTNGAISEDNLGIIESGNGIPDVLDEAKNEVDFWLRLRDGKGYSSGLNNPSSSNILYQSANTGIAAWANAANAAMLSNCYKIAGKTTLSNQYRDSAINAYTYASALSTTDQMLDKMVDRFSGKDFKCMAAAYLYNVTGNITYETDMKNTSTVTSTTSTISSNTQNQLYAVAAYLFTKQTVNQPTLQANMKASLIAEAKAKEANFTTSRPSRRGTDNTTMWFHTETVIQRSIVAHAISAAGADKTLFENALILEADWTLGRNPLNMIQMSTATTPLQNEKSVVNLYSTGQDDGSPGMHPGHTPYMNAYDWGGNMAMGNPTKLAQQSYPTTFTGTPYNSNSMTWPYGELYFNVRYVYAANEFTPQQTMRGKQALYGYLHGISPAVQGGCATPNITGVSSICGLSSTVLQTGLSAANKTFTWYKDGNKITGQTSPTLTITTGGTYRVEVDSNNCVKSSEKAISSILQLDLGANQELCTATEFTLDAGNATIPNVTYAWTPSATTQTIVAKKAGTYSVTVSALNCPSVTDNVTITSKLLSVIGDTICAAGIADLEVTGTATYNWFTVPTIGTSVATGTKYSPSITATKTYYVEEAGGFTANLGKTTAGTGTSWALGNGFTGTDKYNKVTVTKSVTLESIAVYVASAGCSVTINLKQGTDVIHTKTVTGLAIGKQTIPLNFFVIPGEYIIDADGTVGSLTFEQSGGVFPYSYAGYISFTFNESWQSTWYGMFYDWKISVGGACGRTPVTAVLDANHTSCNATKTQTISLQQGWNLISTNIDATNNTVETLFTGLDVEIIKNADVFWKKGQNATLNGLKTIEAGKGYLVKMNSAGTISISGTPTTATLPTIKTGWNLIGCTYQTTTPFTTNFNTTNTQVIKNFDGYWIPNDALSTITNLIPGKGYFLKK